MDRTLVVIALLWLPSIAAPLAAEECSSLRSSASPAAASAIGLFVDARLPSAVVKRAIRAWAACPSYGGGFPSFVVGRGGTRSLYVEFDPAAIGPEEQCGRFSGRNITLFSRTRTRHGSVIGCGALALNLMHELGHALGLADAPRSCDGFAMAKLNPNNAFHRRVQSLECRLVDQRWLPLAVRRSVFDPSYDPTLVAVGGD